MPEPDNGTRAPEWGNRNESAGTSNRDILDKLKVSQLQERFFFPGTQNVPYCNWNYKKKYCATYGRKECGMMPYRQ
jgi:hypothetical protein